MLLHSVLTFLWLLAERAVAERAGVLVLLVEVAVAERAGTEPVQVQAVVVDRLKM